MSDEAEEAPREDSFFVDESAHTAYRLAGVVRIGRAPENTIVITDPTVSRLHCEVWPDGERLKLRSLGSNGTRINGNRVPGTWELEEGDRVDVGWSSFLFTSLQLPLGVHPASRGIASAARRSAAEPSQVASSNPGRDTLLVAATAPGLDPIRLERKGLPRISLPALLWSTAALVAAGVGAYWALSIR